MSILHAPFEKLIEPEKRPTHALTREDIVERRAKLHGSFLLFIQTFFPLVMGRPFKISEPKGRESHFITIARELTMVARGETNSLIITIPPGHGKSTMMDFFVAWTMALNPDSQYLYISYGHELAAKHTEIIRRIVTHEQYRQLFEVRIRSDIKAKDHFQLESGGSVKAFGSSGPITGQDAGLPHCARFSGAVIIDDPHKPDEVHSDSIRQRVVDNYQQTILQRPRGPNVPIILIMQRLHEDDLAAFMMSGKDERKWRHANLPAIDDAGNALYPEVNPLDSLLEKRAKNPYVFSSQYQQEPVPAGGALFKREHFAILDEEPQILATFITADTAETEKSYNDATVFSFWGVYRINDMGIETGQLALHWLDCVEIRIEPKDLKDEFVSFYHDCMLHPIKPMMAAIEKKSTGVTLVSVLKDMRGLDIREVKRTKASGSKTERYLEMQPIIAAKLVSFTAGARHVDMCANHMMKITANGTHRWADIADTCYDACKIALIDKSLSTIVDIKPAVDVSRTMADAYAQRSRAFSNTRGYL